MSRIFLSHSSADNAEAIALSRWLEAEGWHDHFLDLHPERGIAAGERWEKALNEAAHRCQAVVFLVSPAWLASSWCQRELQLAHRLDKHIFGVLIGDVDIESVPPKLKDHWQLVDLAGGRDHGAPVAVELPGGDRHVTFSRSGLQRLKAGLLKAEIDARFFAWPPKRDPDRPPYRGMRPLEAEDAGIFFGREAPTIAVLDRLRGLREEAPPRFLAILGASGAGKSSFLRAGLIPRLARDDRNFLALPILRPERAALSGPTGLAAGIVQAMASRGLKVTRAAIDRAIVDGTEAVTARLAELVAKAGAPGLDAHDHPEPPTLVLSIDQGEELFQAEGRKESKALLELLAGLLTVRDPKLVVLVTIRSDSYERLQVAPQLEAIRQTAFSLPPLPRGAYQTVIEGPAERLKDTGRALKIEPALTAALLADVEEGGARDALPLLAFTLERLYVQHGGDGDLTLDEYRELGGIGGSIEAAVDRALARADGDPAVPRDRQARLALLRRAMIPWLAGIDPETGSPRRQVARLSEIPQEARPLVQHLIAERLLSTEQAFAAGDDADALVSVGEATVEPAHEALLRQWSLLQGWLEEDSAWLATLEGVKRATRDWEANARHESWLSHHAGRLEDAERLQERPDLAANLDAPDRAYLAAARAAETARRDRELEEARKLAEAQARVVRRTRFGLVAASMLTIVAIGAALFGFSKARDAAEEAERSNARAELAQAQYSVKDAPREALIQSVAAVKDLERLGRADQSFASFRSILNTARELPNLKPYDIYDLTEASVIVRQTLGVDTIGPATELNAARQPLTIVGTENLIGILDDSGRAVGPPIAGPNDDLSLTRDAAWISQDTFIVASGQWLSDKHPKIPKARPRKPPNSALRVYGIDGALKQTLIENYEAPITSVATLVSDDRTSIVAGDGVGNLLLIDPEAADLHIVPTGVDRAIRRILVSNHYHLPMLIVVFGDEVTSDAKWTWLRSGTQRQLDSGGPAQQQEKILRQLGLPSDSHVLYVGDQSDGAPPCATIIGGELFLCEPDGDVSVWDYGPYDPKPKQKHRFAAHPAGVRAIAGHPSSTLLATAATTGGTSLWLRNGTLIAELPSAPSTLQSGIGALGFIEQGRRLYDGTRVWDIADLHSAWQRTVDPTDQKVWNYRLGLARSFKEDAWLNGDGTQELAEQPIREDLAEEFASGSGDYLFSQERRFVFAQDSDRSLRVMDTAKSTVVKVSFELDQWSVKSSSLSKFDVGRELSGESDGMICVADVINRFDQTKRAFSRVLAVDLATGSIQATWSPPVGEYVDAIAIQNIDGMPTCVAAVGQALVMVSARDGTVRRVDTLSAGLDPQARISEIIAPKDTAKLLIVASPINDSTTKVAVLDTGGIDDTPVMATFKANMTAATMSSDGSTVALAFDNSEVLLLDDRLAIRAVLPGTPGPMQRLRLSHQATVLRGLFRQEGDWIGSYHRYEQPLRVTPLLDSALERIEAWRQADAREELMQRAAKAREAGDWESVRTILQRGSTLFPGDHGILLQLANAQISSARDADSKMKLLELYDAAIAADPFNQIAYYMRGKARASAGDQRGAADDFSAAIELPGTLPQVKVIAGFLGINAGIAVLSRQLRKQARGELHLRRALASSYLNDWTTVAADVQKLRFDGVFQMALTYELEAMAMEGLGNDRVAVRSYALAAEKLSAVRHYGLEEFKSWSDKAAWRHVKQAGYKKKSGDAYLRLGDSANARAAFAAARKSLERAYDSADMSPEISKMADGIRSQLPQ